ncbi:YbhB/YbcL family Raf kinase inhibitor-like protein [Sinanaerobacter chloroacetimidivorans]|uniref:YbhB/YbcL family Raf kinase inhibitor-like protein n=1 Tax=Sinanaerobacter chloroacetimidivorans TaxID=2818044 RepID=A0A8J7W3A3_9FIRM|nr:YbhB/YbcL family Raf kinase inhibitor-like protein [Sinanaerobacter chloroacetimidivorans]MBR0599586.1 YbhB/YbcL family Raf kinase inhibitor-like protein [Sinanaerobacter chloroacetimidivorans]
MFLLKSEGIQDGWILDRFGIKSEEVIEGVPQRSFPLSWEGAPAGTKSFAIVFQDYDNVPDEGFSWIHWLAADIPGNVTSLPEHASREDAELIQGTNSWAVPYGPYADISKDLTLHYGGPAPGRKHLYEMKIYALDTLLGLRKGFYYNELFWAMEGHVLGESTLRGYYSER